tara:strand:- start:7048 stop:7275 length:228 start_codon:yes stop_codon:yes gene_type:complete
MLEIITQNNAVALVLISLWVLPWKGWALWLSAHRREKWWFIALLVLNTLAILEIIYIFLIAKRQSSKETPVDEME